MEISIPGEPVSTNTIYRYTCRGGRLLGYMSSDGKAKKEEYSWSMKAGRPMHWDTRKLYRVTVRLFFKNFRIHDIDNYNKLILDAGSGILWNDDSQVYELMVVKDKDNKNPRVDMKVEVISVERDRSQSINKKVRAAVKEIQASLKEPSDLSTG